MEKEIKLKDNQNIILKRLSVTLKLPRQDRIKLERNIAILEIDDAYAHIDRLETEIKECKKPESELISFKVIDDSLNEYVEKLKRENYKLREQIDSYRKSEEKFTNENLDLSSELKHLQD